MKQPNCPVKNLCRSINAKGLLFAFIVFILTIAFATNDTSSADYFVSTAGSDSNDGSAAHPWRTIQHASSLVTAGYTVHIQRRSLTPSQRPQAAQLVLAFASFQM